MTRCGESFLGFELVWECDPLGVLALGRLSGRTGAKLLLSCVVVWEAEAAVWLVDRDVLDRLIFFVCFLVVTRRPLADRRAGNDQDQQHRRFSIANGTDKDHVQQCEVNGW